MSKIDDEFIRDLHDLIVSEFEESSPKVGKPPDKAWLDAFVTQALAHRNSVWQCIDNYSSAYWQIGQYEGIVTGLNRAAETLRTRAGQHYAGNKDDLASALRNAAELVDKEAVKAATDTANAKKARGYGP